jgi:phthalate 4,5-dioxygenase oxygenase subunit
MGPIADRSNDRLGASDMAVVEFRKQMLEAVRAFEAGAPAIGTGNPAIPVAYQAVIPKTVDWRDHPCTYVWADGQERPELEPSYSVRA